MILLEATPQFFLMPLLAQWRSENILRPFKAGRIHVVEREVQVLRAGFGINWKPAVASLANFFERVIATQVHDVNRGARHLRQRNSAPHRLGLGSCRPSESVILWCPFTLGQGLLHD